MSSVQKGGVHNCKGVESSHAHIDANWPKKEISFCHGVCKHRIIVESVFKYLTEHHDVLVLHSNRDRNALRSVSKQMKKTIYETSASLYTRYYEKSIQPISLSVYRIQRRTFSELPDNLWIKKWKKRRNPHFPSVFRYSTIRGQLSVLTKRLWSYVLEYFNFEQQSQLSRSICKDTVYVKLVAISFQEAAVLRPQRCRETIYNSHYRLFKKHEAVVRSVFQQKICLNVEITRCVQPCCIQGCPHSINFNTSHTPETHGWAANKLCRNHLVDPLLLTTFKSVLQPPTSFLRKTQHCPIH